MIGVIYGILVSLLITPALGLGMEVTITSSLTFNAEDAKIRPITKVINLLKDMLQQFDVESAKDKEVYEKMVCWCKTNRKEKTASIDKATASLEALTTSIAERVSASSGLSIEIDLLKKDIAEETKSLAEASALRMKQRNSASGEEKGYINTIRSLKLGVKTLSKAHASSFLQLPQNGLQGVISAVQLAITHASFATDVLTDDQRGAVTSFLQGKAKYAPASGEILGVIKQMQEGFENDLGSSQAEEATNEKAYLELKGASTSSIGTSTEQLNSKSLELADTNEKLAQNKQDQKDAKKTLAADEPFLKGLEEKCSMTDREYAARQKSRSTETEAVSKAIAILDSDEARDLTAKTLSFTQTQTSTHSESRNRASEVLSAAAQKFGNPRLAALALRTRKNTAIQKVKDAITTLIAGLQKQSADEEKKKDFCLDKTEENEVQGKAKHQEHSLKAVQVLDKKETIKFLSGEVKELKEQILKANKELKKASEEREKESKVFQKTVADQRATQTLLESAQKVLEGVYAKKAAAAAAVLLQANLQNDQLDEDEAAPPPDGFKAKEKSGTATGVVALLGQIISDAHSMEAEAVKDEEDASNAYKDFVAKTNTSNKAKTLRLNNKSSQQSEVEMSLVQSEIGLKVAATDLDGLVKESAELKATCEFLVKNFDIRQQAREEEVQAMKEAKSILDAHKY